ncbi:MAG TPA: AmmeMemoRadiSam system protein B, partial [Polyangium sp.]|nr:AmmeMemoRadiSam system protein B [Polyangium sp.]
AARQPLRDQLPKVLVVPHAGYIYSGPVAASAFATLRAGRDQVRRVVLLGPAHRVHVNGLVLPEATAFETPLGRVQIDHDAVAHLGLARHAPAHAQEHSLEVEIPFLQTMLSSFTLVPLAVGRATPNDVATVLDALWGGPETLIVVSSDLSHYLPYADARVVDGRTAQKILAFDGPLEYTDACGAGPINGLLVVARRRQLTAVQLDLRTSGDTAGNKREVVGYGAFAFYEDAGGEAGN